MTETHKCAALIPQQSHTGEAKVCPERTFLWEPVDAAQVSAALAELYV